VSVNGVSAQAAETFRFESFDFVKIANSRFYNNENRGLVVVDVPEEAENMTMGFMISFVNISVLENSVKYEENNSSLPSNLFEFKSPSKAIQTEFLNCLFQDNDICNALMIFSCLIMMKQREV